MASINWPGIGSGDGTVQVTSTHELCVSDATARSLLTDIKTLLSNTDSSGLTDVQLRASPVSVSGTFWQAVQPISGSITVTQATGSNLHAVIDSGNLNISNFPATQPVSGTFWPAAQPVTDNGGSLTVDGTVGISGTVPVSGTFWQATQPVSIVSMPATPVTDNGGSLTVDGTVGISGTVPVSGTVTANAGSGTMAVSASSLPLPTGASQDSTLTGGNQKAIIRGGAKGSTAAADVTSTAVDVNTQALDISIKNSSLAVTGTFWQATQPVSIASMPATPVTDNNSTLSVDDGAGSLTVDGTIAATQSGTWNIGSVTTLPALVAGSAIIGKVGIDQTTPGTTNLVAATQSGTWTVQPGNTANTTAWLVTGSTLTKGTQGGTGFSTQNLKDAGRTNVSLTAEAVAGAASEALVTLTQSKAYATATTGTSYNVTAGKTLRLASLAVTFISTTTTANTSRIRVRVNPSGAAVIGSPIAWSLRLGWPTATFIANETNTFTISFPDGMEIPGSGGIAVTHTEAAANGTIDLSMTGFEY